MCVIDFDTVLVKCLMIQLILFMWEEILWVWMLIFLVLNGIYLSNFIVYVFCDQCFCVHVATVVKPCVKSHKTRCACFVSLRPKFVCSLCNFFRFND